MPNETPLPFAPFLPPNETPVEPMPMPPKPAKPEKKKKAAAPASYKVDYTTELSKNKEAETKKRRRTTKKAAPTKRQPRYELQTILKIAGTLKESDQKVFEKLLGELSELAKGSRTRVLKALGEVFG